MTKDQLINIMEELTELGYLEETGEHRPDAEGRLRPVYRISALGHVAHHYVERGLSIKAAIAKAKSSH